MSIAVAFWNSVITQAEQAQEERTSRCKIVPSARETEAENLTQQLTTEWLTKPVSIFGTFSGDAPTNCVLATEAYECLYDNAIEYQKIINQTGLNDDQIKTLLQDILRVKPDVFSDYSFEQLYEQIKNPFGTILDNYDDNSHTFDEIFTAYTTLGTYIEEEQYYEYGRTWTPDKHTELQRVLGVLVDIDSSIQISSNQTVYHDVVENLDIPVQSQKSSFTAISSVSEELILLIDKMVECAETLWDVHKSYVDFSNTESDLNAIGAGVGSGRSGAERAAIFESLGTPEGQMQTLGSLALADFELAQPPKEQCIFLSQIYHLVDHHRKVEFEAFVDSDKRELPYAGSTPDTNVGLTVEGSPFGFINTLTQYQQSSNFFDATNAQIAHLQPMIRLFKVTPSVGESFNERAYEFVFNTFADQDDISNIGVGKNKRGFGAGIKSFNFTYDGSNPFSIKKSIKANLTIYANNFSELLKQRGNIRYIDLALKTGTAVRKLTGEPELDFRIKAVVGLSMPNGITTANFSSISKAVEENYVTLNLTPVTHTFDFDETGAVTFKIEYYAYIEEFLDNARLNIFADQEISKRVTRRRLAYKTAKKSCEDDEQTENLRKLLEEDSQNIKNDKIKSLQFLTTEMFKKNKIYFLSLTATDLEQLAIRGPFYDISNKPTIIDPSDVSDITSDTIRADLENVFNQAFQNVKDKQSLELSFKLSGLESNQFAFFYLGDLLNLVLTLIPKNLDFLKDNLEGEYSIGSSSIGISDELLNKEKDIISQTLKKFEKFRFLLGPIEIVNHANNTDVTYVSLSDVPISLSYFNEWLTSKLLAKEEVEYSLTQFLNDLINNLINNYLNDDTCFAYNIKQRIRLFQNSITSYGDDNNDNITKYLSSTSNMTRLMLQFPDQPITKPILQPAGPRGFNVCHYNPNREYHFFVYYAGRVQPIDQMLGNRCDDEEKGIFHYVLGKDRGIVKTIKLQKDETPGLKEVRFEQEGYDGLRQLREIYNVKIDSVLNVSTFPGTYIFVDPKGFSPDLGSYSPSEFDLTDLGIGGYY
ncbi:MAG: hypothetical protein ACXACY_25025, partial [Candidatus Hodarchaeales archaeon]